MLESILELYIVMNYKFLYHLAKWSGPKDEFPPYFEWHAKLVYALIFDERTKRRHELQPPHKILFFFLTISSAHLSVRGFEATS